MDEMLLSREDEIYDFYVSLCKYLKEFCEDMDTHIPNFKEFDYSCLKTILDDMYNNPDKRFISAFKNCFFSSRLEIVDIVLRDINYEINEYDKMFFHRYAIGYFCTFYTILKAYEFQKDSFENFKCVLDDIGYVELIDIDFKYLKNWFKERNNSVQNIISRDNYKDNLSIRSFLREMVGCNQCDIFKNYCSFLCNLFDDINSFKGDNIFKKIDIDCLVDRVIFWYINSSIVDMINDILYDKILLFGDRFSYVNSRLDELNLFLPERESEIFSMVKKLNINLFEDLQRDGEKDFFITCMDIVFDSDSYHELFSKLDSLKEIGKLYENENRVGALDVIKELNDSKHKDTYCGKIVSFGNYMNKIEKPKRIIDRMKYLYGRIDGSILYDFM